MMVKWVGGDEEIDGAEGSGEWCGEGERAA